MARFFHFKNIFPLLIYQSYLLLHVDNGCLVRYKVDISFTVSKFEYFQGLAWQFLEKLSDTLKTFCDLFLKVLPFTLQILPVFLKLLQQFVQVKTCRFEYFILLIFELLFDLHWSFLDGKDVVALVLVRQDAVDAELLTALLAIGLDWLHICYMAIAELSD